MAICYNDNLGYCTKFSHMMYDGIDESKIEWATNEMMQTPPWISFAIYYDLVMQNGFELLEKINSGSAGAVYRGQLRKNKNSKNVPYYESYGFEHGGHVFFDVYPEEFNQKVLHFVDKVNTLKK